MGPTDVQYQQLLQFRIALRRFNEWSREAAEAHGLTHSQHQLLLAIRGSITEGGPTIGEVAEALLVKPHTATELVDRTEELGFVARMRDPSDSRRVRLHLTDQGVRVIADLTSVHVEELNRLAPLLEMLGSA